MKHTPAFLKDRIAAMELHRTLSDKAPEELQESIATIAVAATAVAFKAGVFIQFAKLAKAEVTPAQVEEQMRLELAKGFEPFEVEAAITLAKLFIPSSHQA